MCAPEDIYDEQGRLLLAKGKHVSSHTWDRLRCYHLENKTDAPIEQPSKPTTINTQDIRQKLNIGNDNLLDIPSTIVDQILFKSKSERWWLIVNTLSNHICCIYAHSINVSIISLMIALELGFNSEALHEIALGSILHDAGKLMIPKSLLFKSNPLNEQELQLIRQHCDLGASITEEYELPIACTKIIHQHHERNDGSGYPLGLKGEEIHPYAQIVMAADVLDAATTPKPYRPAMEMADAIKYLLSGNLFNKDIIDTLKQLL